MTAPICPACGNSVHLVIRVKIGEDYGAAVVCTYCAGIDLLPTEDTSQARPVQDRRYSRPRSAGRATSLPENGL